MQFYESETLLVDCVTSFLATGDDVSAARRDGIYVTRGAAETLSTFMVDGAPDPHRFSDAIGAIVAEAAGGGRRVRVFGVMVALLWRTTTSPPPAASASCGTNSVGNNRSCCCTPTPPSRSSGRSANGRSGRCVPARSADAALGRHPMLPLRLGDRCAGSASALYLELIGACRGAPRQRRPPSPGH